MLALSSTPMIDCFFCSHQDPDNALQCLQTNILKLESYFKSHRLNLNGSKTEFITFSRKNDQRHLDSETVVVCSSVVKKKCECKYLGITLDQHLTFQTQVRKVLKNMAVGIKTIESHTTQISDHSLSHAFPRANNQSFRILCDFFSLKYPLLYYFPLRNR